MFIDSTGSGGGGGKGIGTTGIGGGGGTTSGTVGWAVATVTGAGAGCLPCINSPTTSANLVIACKTSPERSWGGGIAGSGASATGGVTALLGLRPRRGWDP